MPKKILQFLPLKMENRLLNTLKQRTDKTGAYLFLYHTLHPDNPFDAALQQLVRVYAFPLPANKFFSIYRKIYMRS